MDIGDLLYIMVGIILGYITFHMIIKKDLLIIDTMVKKQSNCINKNL